MCNRVYAISEHGLVCFSLDSQNKLVYTILSNPMIVSNECLLRGVKDSYVVDNKMFPGIRFYKTDRECFIANHLENQIITNSRSFTNDKLPVFYSQNLLMDYCDKELIYAPDSTFTETNVFPKIAGFIKHEFTDQYGLKKYSYEYDNHFVVEDPRLHKNETKPVHRIKNIEASEFMIENKIIKKLATTQGYTIYDCDGKIEYTYSENGVCYISSENIRSQATSKNVKLVENNLLDNTEIYSNGKNLQYTQIKEKEIIVSDMQLVEFYKNANAPNIMVKTDFFNKNGLRKICYSPDSEFTYVGTNRQADGKKIMRYVDQFGLEITMCEQNGKYTAEDTRIKNITTIDPDLLEIVKPTTEYKKINVYNEIKKTLC